MANNYHRRLRNRSRPEVDALRPEQEQDILQRPAAFFPHLSRYKDGATTFNNLRRPALTSTATAICSGPTEASASRSQRPRSAVTTLFFAALRDHETNFVPGPSSSGITGAKTGLPGINMNSKSREQRESEEKRACRHVLKVMSKGQ